jgi:hypothetical protein
MKTYIAGVFLLMAGGAAAYDSCHLELEAGLRISEDSIEFYEADKPSYKIVADQYLVVSGQTLKLTAGQQDAVTGYAKAIRAAVPEVHSMALGGIDLAIEAITLTFDGLLGEKNQVSAQLTTELKNTKSDVNRYFTSGRPISLNRAHEDTPDFLGKQFETRIERIVETSVQNSIGSIMIAMGKEILAAGGSMQAFEERMNKFGEQMELQMNAKATGLEEQGKKLCNTMHTVDAREEQLKLAVPAVESFNVIRVKAASVDVAQREI